MIKQKNEKFEQFIKDIFIKSGYNIETCNSSIKEYDFIAIDNELRNNVRKKYYINVNWNFWFPLRDLDITEKNLHFLNLIEKDAYPTIITFQPLKESDKQYLTRKYIKLIVLDISNILYAVYPHKKKFNELLALLPYSVSDIVMKEGKIKLSWSEYSDYSDNTIQNFLECGVGKENSEKFERLCVSLLKDLFADDLTLWEVQKKSNNDLYRFDLMCRIKENSKSFWNIIEDHFNTKYVIFEFKNYSSKITQREVYTTEKYLYNKALRNLAIIISPEGEDDNALWAAKGALRENGKLIIFLSKDDIVKMTNDKNNQGDPTECLQNKLDRMLADLEK